jgi:lipopolysaccharide export system protein LptA
MRIILIAILFFVPVLLVAQQTEQDTLSPQMTDGVIVEPSIGQDTLSPDTPQRKRIRILNSDISKTIESDTGTISRFWHNVKMEHEGVVMECDSATLWPTGIFEAFGNTKVTSGATVVTGDMMIYSEITGKANVKGKIVHLIDSSATLRTTEIDFDTGTEIGYFEHEGTIVDSFRTLESQKGYYYAKIKEFEFIGQVQSDTKDYVLQSDSMKYNTNTKIFTFYSNTHIWSENGYLYCDKGWYDSDKSIMFFYRNSYMLSAKQEIFADSIYYEDEGKKGRLYSNVQVTDTAQKTIALADFADFDMGTEDFLMRRNPSIIMYDDKDSVFLRADTLYSVTRTMKVPIIKNDSTEVAGKDSANVAGKFTALKNDSANVAEKFTVLKKDSANVAGKFAVLKRDSANVAGKFAVLKNDSANVAGKFTVLKRDSANVAGKFASFDTGFVTSVQDSILPDTTRYSSNTLNPPDSIQYVDSTYKELFAFKNAKLYRSDFQVKSDSMYFNNLDSIWRIYLDPILWNGKKMQIVSDSMKFFIKNGEMDHVDFNGNAMVVVPEGDPDSTSYFNQVKSKNMKAYLKNRELNRFDAMGNVRTIAFSLNDFTMNSTEAASLKILFNAGKARHIIYYDQVTGNNNPFFIVREDETKLPNFSWDIDLRPKSGNEILNRLLRLSERPIRELLPKPSFPITKRIDELELKINN